MTPESYNAFPWISIRRLVKPHAIYCVRILKARWLLPAFAELYRLLRAGAQPGGNLEPLPPPEIFKTLQSNFDVSRNFQIIKLKYCVLIILKKSYGNISLSYWLSPYKMRQGIWSKISQRFGICSNHKYAGIGRSFKMLVAYV